MIKIVEPLITTVTADHASDISRAFYWYHTNKEKKDARQYLKDYAGRDKAKIIDRVPDSMIIATYGWLARTIMNGSTIDSKYHHTLDSYISSLSEYKGRTHQPKEDVVEVEKVTVRDLLEQKIEEYIGELEGTLDLVVFERKEFSLLKDMQSRALSVQYVIPVSEWIKKKAGVFIYIYENDEKEIKEGYSNIGKRDLAFVIKTLNTWLEELGKFTQFKKANRKPRVKKSKPASVQVAKLKYKKEDTTLNIKSIQPVEIIGASQVWIYNTKYKRLAVYRTESKEGIQIKGSTLQNYDPEMCEQRSIKKPTEVIAKVRDGGKLALRKLLSEMKTGEYPVTGRINDECLIIRSIK